jgi:hypothetical protein
MKEPPGKGGFFMPARFPGEGAMNKKTAPKGGFS